MQTPRSRVSAGRMEGNRGGERFMLASALVLHPSELSTGLCGLGGKTLCDYRGWKVNPSRRHSMYEARKDRTMGMMGETVNGWAGL